MLVWGLTQALGEGGTRGYLAVAGGLDVPVYLGSKATFPGGSLGGVQASRPCTVSPLCAYPNWNLAL